MRTHEEMSREAIEKIQHAIKTEDTEDRHIVADQVLSDLLDELGFKDVTKVYWSFDRWWA